MSAYTVSNRVWKIIVVALALFLLSAGFVPSAGMSQSVVHAGFVDQKLDAALVTAVQGAPLDIPHQVVIVFADTTAVTAVGNLATTFYPMQALPMAGAILTGSQIMEMANWPEIYSITLNSPLEYFLAESVPLVKADQVWAHYGESGGNVTVAVVDSGIDATHPDLLYGETVIQNVKVLPFQASLENQLQTDTTSGHGTHVAGTIGGTGAFSDGHYRGVAPGVKLVGLGAGEGISILTAVQAYDWVLQNHAEYNIRVISNSWGSSGGEINVRNPIVLASYEAYKLGMLSVFAAGNDGGYDILNPYSLSPWLLSVAAGKKDGSLADFSSRGKEGDYFKYPDIVAPGVDIYATRSSSIGVTGLDPWPNPVNPLWTAHYTVMSGTSMATPHVSGAAALLFSNNPDLSPDEVMDLLTAHANPMPGTMLHEAGFGYMDVLAAYEASLNVSGSLAAFLAGDRQESLEDVLGFDPEYPAVYDEYLYSGITVVGATGASGPIDHPFTVVEGVQYVDILLTWTPQAQDAYDLEVLDPQGRVVVSSGNFVDEAEMAIFVPETTGVYTLRIWPFAAVATQYEARVKIAYGQPPENWPPHGQPTYDYYLGVAGIYKTNGVLGIRSDYFRGGDQGFIVFTLGRGDGTPVSGAAANLQIIYSDRDGQVIRVDNNASDRGGGEYSSSFNINNSWTGLPGAVTVSFAWSGEGSLRAVPTGFSLNHLAITLNTPHEQYEPGDLIPFSGNVAQVNTVTTGNISQSPLTGALVTLRLLDKEGNRLASTQAQTNLQGNYSGTLQAPAVSAGRTTLVAEVSYQDSTILTGPKQWYGRAERTLHFPGNSAPELSLYASPYVGPGNVAHIEATISDADGAADVVQATLSVQDAKGRLLFQWTLADFQQSDDNSWTLARGYRLRGLAPWTVTFTAGDSAADSATATATMER
jgi:hypothetical protein